MALVYVHIGKATSVTTTAAVALLTNVRVGNESQRTRARPVEEVVEFGEVFMFPLRRVVPDIDVNVEVLGLTSAPLPARTSLLASSSPLAKDARSSGSVSAAANEHSPVAPSTVVVLGEIALSMPRMGKLLRSSVWLGSAGGGMVSIAIKCIAADLDGAGGPWLQRVQGWVSPEMHGASSLHVPLVGKASAGTDVEGGESAGVGAQRNFFDNAETGPVLTCASGSWTRDVPVKKTYLKSDLFTSYIENPATESRWYARFFAGNVHDNFVAKSEAFRGGVVVVSTMLTTIPGLGNQYWVIVWSKESITRRILSVGNNETLRFPDVLARVAPEIYKMGYKLFSKLAHPNAGVERALVSIENGDEPQLRMKIGVLFAKEGQTHENDMFSNRDGTAAFEEFLDLLGERVTLKGYTGYSAQLDTRNDGSGLTSVATKTAGYDIMFHVSTLLQYDPTDEQRIQRKRFIGNDIVVIVFMDGSTPYDVGTMKSQYTNVLLVVQPHPTDPSKYLVSTANGPAIPPFGPEAAVEYGRDEDFVDFLLAKAINGQTATCAGAEFQIREKRTRAVLLDNLYNELDSSAFVKKKKKKTMYEFASTGRQFLQALPLAEPQVFQLFPLLDGFPHAMACFDSIDETLFFGTPEGVYRIAVESSQCHKVTDLANVGQISLVPEHNMLLILTAPPSSRLYAFSLVEILSEATGGAAGSGAMPEVSLVPVKSPLAFEVGVLEHRQMIAVAVPDGAVHVFSTSGAGEFEFVAVLRTPGTSVNALAFTPTGLTVGYESVDSAASFVFFHFTSERLPDTAGPGAVENLFLPYPLFTADALDAVPMDSFYIPGTGLFLCFQEFGVLVSPEGSVVLRMVWEIAPISFAMFGVFLIVYSVGIAQVRSLINGTLIESHLLMTTQPFVCAGDTLFAPIKGYDSWSVAMLTPVHKYPELLAPDSGTGTAAAEAAAAAAAATAGASTKTEPSLEDELDAEYSRLRRGRETTRMHRRSIAGLQQIATAAILDDDDDGVVHKSSLEAMWEEANREHASAVDAAAAAATASLEVEASRRRDSLTVMAAGSSSAAAGTGSESDADGSAVTASENTGGAARSSGAVGGVAMVQGMDFGTHLDVEALSGVERSLFRFGVCMNELIECIASKDKAIIIQSMAQVVNQIKVITRLVEAGMGAATTEALAAASGVRESAAVALRAGKRVMTSNAEEDWRSFARENLALTVATHKLYRAVTGPSTINPDA